MKTMAHGLLRTVFLCCFFTTLICCSGGGGGGSGGTNPEKNTGDAPESQASYTFFADEDPRLVESETPNGETVTIYGRKEPDGRISRMDYISAWPADADEPVFLSFDDDSRPARFWDENGTAIDFTWISESEIVVLIKDRDGEILDRETITTPTPAAPGTAASSTSLPTLAPGDRSAGRLPEAFTAADNQDLVVQVRQCGKPLAHSRVTIFQQDVDAAACITDSEGTCQVPFYYNQAHLDVENYCERLHEWAADNCDSWRESFSELFENLYLMTVGAAGLPGPAAMVVQRLRWTNAAIQAMLCPMGGADYVWECEFADRHDYLEQFDPDQTIDVQVLVNTCPDADTPTCITNHSDSLAWSDPKEILVDVTASADQPCPSYIKITQPVDQIRFEEGSRIHFSAAATYPDGTEIPAQHILWRIKREGDTDPIRLKDNHFDRVLPNGRYDILMLAPYQDPDYPEPVSDSVSITVGPYTAEITGAIYCCADDRETSEPVADATVSVTPIGPQGTGSVLDTTASGQSGLFALQVPVDAGFYRITIEKQGYLTAQETLLAEELIRNGSYIADIYLTQADSAPINAADTLTIGEVVYGFDEIRLTEGQTYEGRVVTLDANIHPSAQLDGLEEIEIEAVAGDIYIHARSCPWAKFETLSHYPISFAYPGALTLEYQDIKCPHVIPKENSRLRIKNVGAAGQPIEGEIELYLDPYDLNCSEGARGDRFFATFSITRE